MSDRELKPTESLDQEAKQQQQQQAFEEEEMEKGKEGEDQAGLRATKLAVAERFEGVSEVMTGALGPAPKYEPDERLSVEENRALEIIFRVKVGQDEEGRPASARTRKILLNQALATIQPILSVAFDPELREQLDRSYVKVQSGVEQLRDELKTATLMQMHSGRGTLKRPDKEEAADGDESQEEELAELGSLAFELAQLGRKKRRGRFPHALDENPVGHALEAIEEAADAMLGLLSKLARISDKLQRAKGEKKRKSLREEWEILAAELAAAVATLLAGCSDDRSGEPDPGRYPVLREKFAPLLTKYGETTDSEQVMRAAGEIVEVADWCAENQDEIAAEAKSAT